jgi:hypothetical protein
MTGADLLAALQDHKVELSALGDKLRWRCPPGTMTEEVRRLLTEHKTELMALLCPSWNAAEADHLLVRLRAEVERVIRSFGSNVPQDLANVLRTWLEVAEGYVQDHEKEAARGFDVMAALRRLPENVRESVTNWKMMNDAGIREQENDNDL